MDFQHDVHSCLPSEFLTDEDSVFISKDGTGESEVESKLSSCFPTEFPYEFDSYDSSSSLSSPEESVLGSFETENTDRDEFFARITRRLSQNLAAKPVKKWVMSSSPESTLNGLGSWSASSNGSPSGVLSPPATPFVGKSETWDLIHEAAGEIERLKLNREVSKSSYFQDTSFPGPAMTHNSVGQPRNHFSGFHNSGQDIQPYRQHYQMRQELQMGLHAQGQPYNHLQNHHQQIPVKSQNLGYENRRCFRPTGLPYSAWPAQIRQSNQHHQHLQHPSSGMEPTFRGGSGVKRECSGTGVFLPRRYGNNDHSSELKKKTACPTVLLPAKVVHALNLEFDDMNSYSYGHIQPCFSTDYDVVMARRNAILAHRRRNCWSRECPEYIGFNW